ncbi:MAG: phage shock protein operon transcriptional activator [Acetobacteraceae bacterium]
MAISPTPPTPLGESPAFLDMLAHVSRLAPLDRPVLVVGERGTGKELIATRLAYLSPRWDRPFVALNCAALAESLLDSELFGHEAGAFTSATRRRAGRFELADGGTLFLDEIANAALAVQEKILRAIEYGRFERVGGNDTLGVDVRVIAATNADLPALAAAGRFRADLLDRLAFDVVRLPPLRERTGDIGLLATHFATAMTAALGRDAFPGFASAALDALDAYAWPGNVRELRNAVERSVCRMTRPDRPLAAVVIDPFGPAPGGMAPGGMAPAGMAPGDGASSAVTSGQAARSATAASALPAAPDPSAADGGLRPALHALEKRLLAEALAATRFNQRQAAARLGLGYDQFRRHLRAHPELRAASGR